MATKVGKNCKVTLGTDKILGMGTWSMAGVTTDMHEDTEYGDDWKTYVMGLKDGGTISFNGVYDTPDATGQAALRTYCDESTDVTSLRLWIDSVSYWVPTTTNPLSHVNITDWSVESDKGGMMTASFTAKISGKMELI